MYGCTLFIFCRYRKIIIKDYQKCIKIIKNKYLSEEDINISISEGYLILYTKDKQRRNNLERRDLSIGIFFA